jgi:hypothetical protein
MVSDTLPPPSFYRKKPFKCSKCGLEGKGDPRDFFATEEVEHYLGGCEGSLEPFDPPYEPFGVSLICPEPRMFVDICGVEGKAPLCKVCNTAIVSIGHDVCPDCVRGRYFKKKAFRPLPAPDPGMRSNPIRK